MICSSVNRLRRMVHFQWMDPTYQWQEIRGARHRVLRSAQTWRPKCDDSALQP